MFEKAKEKILELPSFEKYILLRIAALAFKDLLLWNKLFQEQWQALWLYEHSKLKDCGNKQCYS